MLELKRVVMEVFGGCNYTCQMCPQSNPGRGKNFTRKMKLSEFEKTLDQLDLVNYYSIEKLNKKYTFYKIVYNGSSSNFINVMKNKNYTFNTQKKIWILK